MMEMSSGIVTSIVRLAIVVLCRTRRRGILVVSVVLA